MEIREIELPGIGKKFELVNGNDEKMVVIIHDDGKREMYHFDKKNDEECLSNVTFDDEEARKLAAILGGMVYKPKALDEIEMSFEKDFTIKWQKVDPTAPAVGKTIGEIDIRNRYGIMIIAIVHQDKKKQLNPGPQTTISKGDTLIISGEVENVKYAIKELLSGDKGVI